MNPPYTKPIPNLDDPEMSPFWRQAKQHRLTAQQCTACRTYRFPALPICPECQAVGFDWVEVSPQGTIWSYAVYHRAFHPGFKDDLPYVVAIVENEDGIRYTGRIIGPRERITVGARVKVTFLDATENFTLPMWELDSSPG